MLGKYSLFPILVLIAGLSMTHAADLIEPSDYEIGMDYKANQAEYIPSFGGEPPYGIDNPLGGPGGISSNINFNNSMLPGTTRATIAFRFLPDPSVELTPEVRVRFHYWPETLWVTAFEDTEEGYATDVTFRLAIKDDGTEYVEVIEDVRGMEYMRASKMRLVSGPLKPREWNEVEIDLTTRFAFPERRWTSGVQLEANQETREAVEKGFHRQYKAFQDGFDSAFAFYRPQMEADGASYGMTAQEWFEHMLADVFSDDYRLMPFDASKSELRIFGYGRLATLHPSPVRFEVENRGIATPFMYFWKDAEGNWHPRD